MLSPEFSRLSLGSFEETPGEIFLELSLGLVGRLCPKLSVRLFLNGSSENPRLILPRVLCIGDTGMLWTGLLFDPLRTGDEIKDELLRVLHIESKSV